MVINLVKRSGFFTYHQV